MPEKEYYGSRPYGLRRDPNDRFKTVKDYNEVAAIDTICHRRRQGDSFVDICRWMDGIGVRPRSGKSWHPMQIKRILNREGIR